MRRLASAWLVLTTLYLAVLGSLRPGDVAVGAVLAAAILAGCRRFMAGTSPAAYRGTTRVHLAALPALGAATLMEITRGAFDVARATLAPTPCVRPGLVVVPLPEASAAGLATLTLAITLSPGSVLVEIDRRRGTMLVHVVDARDPDAIRARLLEFDRRWRQPAVE